MSIKTFYIPSVIFLLILIMTPLALMSQSESDQGPYLATGIRIGDVSQTEAVIWARLTKNKNRVNDAPLPISLYTDPTTNKRHLRKTRRDKDGTVYFPQGYDINTVEGAVPGIKGELRVHYKPDDLSSWKYTDWEAVDPEANYSKKFVLDKLHPGKTYELLVEARPENGITSAQMKGKFKTPPDINSSRKIVFGASTCQGYPDQDHPDGYKIYPFLESLDLDFFVHAGDILYYDNLAKNKSMAHYHWDRMFSLPTNKSFHAQVTSYFEKDDHDAWFNDSYRGIKSSFMGDFTFDQGLAVFRQEMPIKDKTYRTFRWGKDLQIWLVEGRDYRSPNTQADGPDKTIWGKEQMEWFKQTVEASDATFKILISPTPVIGPDRSQKKDNHSNKGFYHEGEIIRKFIASQPNMYVICGDRHWQYVSEHQDYGIVEFSIGANSDDHAGGWKQEDVRPEHLYLNVVGGTMTVTIDPKGKGSISVVHYDVNGNPLNEFLADAE
ncbi:MAG: alkaline phosphatase D family protein [Flavobacteriaceae bacterium]|tara:strand:+ start:1937 stop:3418 length:1482 start_codon:yes stop_codon:yes gene_type:complete